VLGSRVQSEGSEDDVLGRRVMIDRGLHAWNGIWI
jgi:hypothetical protein